MNGSSPHTARGPVLQLRNFLTRLSQWDVLNLPPGSHDDGPYWQGEIRVAQEALRSLEEQLEVALRTLRKIRDHSPSDDPAVTEWAEQAYHEVQEIAGVALVSSPAISPDGAGIDGEQAASRAQLASRQAPPSPRDRGVLPDPLREDSAPASRQD